MHLRLQYVTSNRPGLAIYLPELRALRLRILNADHDLPAGSWNPILRFDAPAGAISSLMASISS